MILARTHRFRRVSPLVLMLALAATAQAQLFGKKDKDKDAARADGAELSAIRCIAMTGPDRDAAARNWAAHLKAVAGLKAEWVTVIPVGSETVVYYGRYTRKFDTRSQKETYKPAPNGDLELIRSLSAPISDPLTGQRIAGWPFRLARLESLPAASAGKNELDLASAPGYWSLQIAVFYNVNQMDQRKSAAEQYCKLLRQQGDEAYLMHGETNSIVCVGAFPKEAIQTYDRANPLTGIREFWSKIVDERMLDLQRKYPHNTHNGATFYDISMDPKTGGKLKDPHQSFAVQIPR